MKTTRFFAVLALVLGTCVVLAQLKISQYPNTATPQPGDLFILASGVTNKNVSWTQLQALLPNNTNVFTNFSGNIGTFNSLTGIAGYFDTLSITNLYAQFFYPTTVYAGNIYGTNITGTNVYGSNAFFTNLTAGTLSGAPGVSGSMLFNSNGVYAASTVTYTSGAPSSITIPTTMAYPASTLQTLAAANTIAVSGYGLRVVGNGGAVVLTSQPEIATNAVADGTEIVILGTSDANTVTLSDSRTTSGTGSALLMRAPVCPLYNSGVIGFRYSTNINRWKETYRSQNGSLVDQFSNIGVATNAYISNNIVAGGGQFTNAVTTTSPSSNAPTALEFPTAGWVRGLFNNGSTTLYNSTNSIGGTAFDNPTYTYTNVIPYPASRTYASGVLTPNSYFGSVITTNRYMQIQGPIYISTYMQSSGGGASSLYTVHPEIYVVYDTNALATIGDWESGAQSLIHGTVTNRYDFVVAVPQYVATNTTGFYLCRRFKVNTQTGTDSIIIYVGTNTPSQISFQSPTIVGANWTANGSYDSTLAGSATVGTNINLSGNTIYLITTNTTTTNVVVDFASSVQRCNFTNSITLLQSTNRTADTNHLAMTQVMLKNLSGAALTVTTNPALGWMYTGSTFPISVPNNARLYITFEDAGPYETNVVVGNNLFQ
jgi:hypothetical protein